MSETTRHYVLIDLATSLVAGYGGSYSYTDSPGEDEAISPPGTLMREVSNEELAGFSIGEFANSKKAVLVNEEFHHWEARHSGLNCAISAAPKNDGSNTPYISLADGLPNSAFRVTASAGVALNAQATGTLNGTGDATFRVKITDGSIVLGSVMISPDGHDDFVPVSFSFNVEAGDF